MDSNAVPFPRPLLLLGDARTLLGKRKLCPKKLCHFRGSPQESGSEMSPFAAEYRPKPACSTQNKAKRANEIVFLLLVRDQGVGGSNPLAPTILPCKTGLLFGRKS